MKFEKYSFTSEIQANLEKLGFIKPTDIQFKAIPAIMRGEDLFAVAQTGTGKTGAFAIPIINRIHAIKKSKRTSGISTLIMVPTRELALQIGSVFTTIAKNTRVKIFTLHGGVEQDRQIEHLQSGIDILITTPGRMFDLINQEILNIEKINTLVLDEADRMLDLGFLEDIEYVKKMLKMRHQTLFFTATINPEIKKIAFSLISSSAIRVEISPKDPVSKNITHHILHCTMDEKRFFLENLINENAEKKIIIFVRTKVRAERVFTAMQRVGIETGVLHSDRDQKERSATMESFRSGNIRILIATDISARGIDIPDISIVINYDLPEIAENYVHRIGRTGRGFNKGHAVSFCAPEEDYLKDLIETYIGKRIETLTITDLDRHIITTPKGDELEAIEQLLLTHEEESRKSRRKKR